MTKVISLSEEAYAHLKARKLENESFSDAVNRLCARNGSLMDIIDLYPDLKDVDEFEDAILQNESYTEEMAEKVKNELS
jgi:predicted CopG family antitoxin